MRLFRLTLSTLFRRHTWIVGALVVLAGPFILARLSTGPENPALMKPALAQAAWGLAWLVTIFWGFFAAASLGQQHTRSGLGEFFQSSGVSATRQLLEIWLAVFTFVAPLGLAAALVCSLAAAPALPDERAMWIANNFQYALLFVLVVAPLLALAISLASRFGSIAGFTTTAGLTLYGLYGVGYMKMLISLEGNRLLGWMWTISPHYHFADPTERLRYKLGAIEWSEFPLLLGYFGGIALIYLALSRASFRVRASA